MRAKSLGEIAQIYGSIQAVKNLSDRIVRLGPINIIGLDGILALIPIPALGTIYSAGAGLIILYQGFRARVSPGTWLTALLILLIDSGFTTLEDVTKIIPVAGPFLNLVTGGFDAVFQGHLYAAHIIQKDIDRTHYVEAVGYQAHQSGAYADHKAEMKATKGKNRIVYLKG